VPRFLVAGLIACALLCWRAAALADELPCKLDDALSQAAADLLLTGSALDGPQLTAAVRAAGSDAAGLHAVRAADLAALKAWLRDLRSRADADLSCGEAASESGRLLIATAQGGTLSPIDPVSRVVRGRLTKGFDHAELVIAAADGSLTRVGASAEVLARGVPLAQDLPPPIHVQLVARGPAGPRPIAERTLTERKSADGASGEHRDAVGDASRTAAAAAPGKAAMASAATTSAPAPSARGASATSASASSAPAPNASAADSGPAPSASAAASAPAAPADASALGSLLVDLRRSRGLRVPRDNRLLREAATEHARAVCREGRVAHELERGQGPEARLASAGLSARLLGEAIARATDADSALHALEQSPSHLLTLIEPSFTDVGVGAASDGHGKSCFVVLLCAWPRYMGR
jgi:uncharacterized protein YkwD